MALVTTERNAAPATPRTASVSSEIEWPPKTSSAGEDLGGVPSVNGNGTHTLADAIHDALRDEILHGHRLPGEPIYERSVARQRGASRTPVRESLRRLEQTGLVQRDARAGYVVRPFSLEEMDQLYDVRLALEELAIRTLCAKGSAERFQRIRQVLSEFPDRGEPGNALAADEAFHEAVAEECGNGVLEGFLKAINVRIQVMRRIDFTAAHRWEETRREHAHVLDLAEAGDIEGAAKLLNTHILGSKAKVADLVRVGQTTPHLAEMDTTERPTT